MNNHFQRKDAEKEASALVWQKDLPLASAYSNIYWGLTVIVILSMICALVYLRLLGVRIGPLNLIGYKRIYAC